MQVRSGVRCTRSQPSQLCQNTRVCRTRPVVIARASHKEERSLSPWKAAQGLAFSCAAAALLVLGAPQSSFLQPPAANAVAAVEQGVTSDLEDANDQDLIEEQKNMLGFMLQQQENAKKAAILAQRQSLQQEVGRVEAAIQARLTQQKANIIGATQAGDQRAIENATAAATELEEKQQQIFKAAAQLSSQLDRMELIERARSISAKQLIDRAASGTPDATVNVAKLNPWLEALRVKAATAR